MNFAPFSKAVATRFAQMSKQQLYVVDVDRNELWDTYLAAFPEGTNPIHKERTEHDCNCCKGFIRRVGNVVMIKNGQLETIWDIKTDSPYAEVAKVLNEYVKNKPIVSVFLNDEKKVGNAKNVQIDESGKAITWNHFVADIPANYVDLGRDATRGSINAAMGVFKRGLDEINQSSLDTVLDLIDADAIYRGTEHRKTVQSFRNLLDSYSKLNSDEARNIFIWDNINDRSIRFRNSVIGTLVSDITSGVELADAVRMFESKVAPTNYKRTTALITPTMVKSAMKTVAKLGIEDSLNRRFAHVDDVALSDIIWANRDTQSQMRDASLTDRLMEETTSRSTSGGSEIRIDDFIKNVLPSANKVDAMVSNSQVNNLMSVVAPMNPDAPNILKWDNNFSWSYNNNVTDSIKARVKRAGGNVDAALRISLSWLNTDDLDIHVIEPNGNEIYYDSKDNKRGKLDVDMNVTRAVRDAVEHVSFTRPCNGKYTVMVNNFTKRESVDVGFVIEVATDHETTTFTYDKAVGGRETVNVVEFLYDGNEIELVTTNKNVSLDGGTISQDQWGISTNRYVPVSMVMNSPNHWGGQDVGNKHFCFILDGCLNPDPTRGIYNEFLDGKLNDHRKVFEVIADKTKCPPSGVQLSGLGFSSTQRNQLAVKVDGRPMNINF